MAERRLLILGGTGEALALAQQASRLPGLWVVSALAGRTRKPVMPAGEARIGGFGGADGLAEYLRDAAIDLLVDATHPFAAEISRNAVAARAATGVPLLTLTRPAWQPRDGDRWTVVADADAAATALTPASRVFLAVGRGALVPFARADAWFLVRVIDPPDAEPPLKDYTLIEGRGPFRDADERALLIAHRIDTVVAKNSGGEATYAKIAAARALGLPVVMIRRPPPPAGESVASVEEAMAWLRPRLSGS
jgi:precorrin-6A/cobalt-precorrin-6A reductase